MSVERYGVIKVGGSDATIIGYNIKARQAAPEFLVQALDWSPIHGLADTRGKVRIIASVPSLETEVCDQESRHLGTNRIIMKYLKWQGKPLPCSPWDDLQLDEELELCLL